MKVKRVVPDYVRQGSCSDCLKVWSKERDALLRQIDALERQVAALKEEQGIQFRNFRGTSH